MENIIVVGSSGHAVAVIDAIEKNVETEGKYHIIGLVDDYRKPGEETFDFRVLGGIGDLPQLMGRHSANAIVIAIGDNFNRWKVAEKIKGLCPAAHFPPIVHPRAIIGMKTSIGEGTFIGAGVLISPAATIGKFCLLTSGSIFGHHAVMGDFSCIFAQSVVGAYCQIGFGASISMGVTVGRKITIGEQTVIGAGSVVVKDLPSYVVAYGAPAKAVRDRKAEEKYF